jgi:DNA-binding response OmpR family regulator
MAKITVDTLEFDEWQRTHGMEKTGKIHERRPFVLVLDDVLQFLNIVAGVLGDDYDVGVAQNSKQALRIMQKRPVNLLILDQGMHDIMGLDFLKNLRGISGMENLPVIFLSANITQDFIIEAKKLGVNYFLTKPVKADDLKKAAKYYLGEKT